MSLANESIFRNMLLNKSQQTFDVKRRQLLEDNRKSAESVEDVIILVEYSL